MPTTSKRQAQKDYDVRVAKALCTGARVPEAAPSGGLEATLPLAACTPAIAQFIASLGHVDSATIAAAPLAWQHIFHLIAASAGAGPPGAVGLAPHMAGAVGAATSDAQPVFAAPVAEPAKPPPAPGPPASPRSGSHARPAPAVAPWALPGVHDLAQLLNSRGGAGFSYLAGGPGPSTQGRQGAVQRAFGPTPQKMLPARQTLSPVVPTHLLPPAAAPTAAPSVPAQPSDVLTAPDCARVATAVATLPARKAVQKEVEPMPQAARKESEPESLVLDAGGGSCGSGSATVHVEVPAAASPRRPAAAAAALTPDLLAKSAQPLLAAVAAAAAEDAAAPPSPTAAAGIAESQRQARALTEATGRREATVGRHMPAASQQRSPKAQALEGGEGSNGDGSPAPATAAAPPDAASPIAASVQPQPEAAPPVAPPVAASAAHDLSASLPLLKTCARRTPPPAPAARAAPLSTATPMPSAAAQSSGGPQPAVGAHGGAVAERAAMAPAPRTAEAHMHAAGGHAASSGTSEELWQFAEAQGVCRARAYPVDAEAAKRDVLGIYFRNEQLAKDRVQEIARVRSVALPSLLKFRNADEQASTFRVAALTSAAFLHACSAQLAPPRGSSPMLPPSASAAHRSAPADPGIAVPGVTAAALAVLVRLIEGSPPAELTVDAACELTAAAHACGSEALLAVLPDYLTPLLHQASDKEVAWILACSLRSTPGHLRPAFADRFVAVTFPPLPVLSSKAPLASASPRRTPTDPPTIAALTIFAVQSLYSASCSPAHAQSMLHMAALPRAPGWLRAACVAAACMSCGDRADATLARSACLHSAYVADAFLRCGHTACCAAIRQVYSGACMQSMHVPRASHPPCLPTRAQHHLLSSVRQQLAVQEQGYEVSMVACSAGKRDIVVNAVAIALSAADACTLHAQVSLMRVGDSVLLPMRPSMPHRLLLLSMLQFPKAGADADTADRRGACAAQPLQGWQLRAEAAGDGSAAVTAAAAADSPQFSGESSTAAAPGAALRVALARCGGSEIAATANVGFVPDIGAPFVARAIQSVWDLHDRKNMPHLQPAAFKGLHAHAWPCCKRLRFKPGDVKVWDVAAQSPVPESWRAWHGAAGGGLAGKVVFAFACVDLE